MNRRVVFRADGNQEIGYGHFVRTLGFADLISDKFHCVFAIQDPTEYQLNEINKVCHDIIKLDSENHNRDFFDNLESGDIVVVDSYSFEESNQLEIRNKGCKVIYIDDHNDKHYVCDILINNIPGFKKESFRVEDYTKLYLGTDYALLRKEFFNPELRNIQKKKYSVFLSFGGSDIFNLSEKLIEYLYQISSNYVISLLIGDAYKYHENLKKFDKLKIYKNVSAKDVAEMIAASDVCIIPASSLLNEAACIGSKILLGYFSDNQIQPYNYFVENNLALGLGDFRELDVELLRNRLNEIKGSDLLIENQKKRYRYQQEDNLKSIFYHV